MSRCPRLPRRGECVARGPSCRRTTPVESATVGREGFVGVAAAWVPSAPSGPVPGWPAALQRLDRRAASGGHAAGAGGDRAVHRDRDSLRRAPHGRLVPDKALMPVRGRACRWLAHGQPAVSGDREFPMTQAFLAASRARRTGRQCRRQARSKDAGLDRRIRQGDVRWPRRS